VKASVYWRRFERFFPFATLSRSARPNDRGARLIDSFIIHSAKFIASILDSSSSIDSMTPALRLGVNVNRTERFFGPVNLAVTAPKAIFVRVVSCSRARLSVSPGKDFDDRFTADSVFLRNGDAVSYRLNCRESLHFFWAGFLLTELST